MITPPMGQPPSSYPFFASRTPMRMKSLSVSYLKNPSSTILGRLLFGRWAIIFKTSFVTGVSLVMSDIIKLLSGQRRVELKGFGEIHSLEIARKREWVD